MWYLSLQLWMLWLNMSAMMLDTALFRRLDVVGVSRYGLSKTMTSQQKVPRNVDVDACPKCTHTHG